MFDFIDDEEPVRAPYPDHAPSSSEDDSGAGLLVLLFFGALGAVVAWQLRPANKKSA